MKKSYLLAAGIMLLVSCTKKDFIKTDSPGELTNNRSVAVNAEAINFSPVGSIDIGNTGAAEISAFDPLTKKLFVVNNTSGNNRIDIIDFNDPASMQVSGQISIAPYGGLVNSVSVKNGKLAAAIEAINKTDAGKVVVFNTENNVELAVITVGALPDMVTFSPDGKYILTANEGEPNSNYSIDPEGSVSIIEVNNNYAVTTLNFSAFENQKDWLLSKGFRIYGPNASFAQDIEPEYVAVSANSQFAWVSLQENNGIAKIDLSGKTITGIFPLGTKDFNTEWNAIDASDRDNIIGSFNPWPVKAYYLPDALAVMPHNNIPFVFSANEGDAREYDTYVENKRAGSITLDATAFPNAAELKNNAKLGRLNITTTKGDFDGDGDYDELYSGGGRSFSIWNGNTGELIFDSKNELDRIAVEKGFYDDGRSDDKGVEPEGVAIGRVGNKTVLFVGMERANAVAVYDITNPVKPKYLQMLKTGVGPEGVLFINAEESPTGSSLLVVSSETDGVISVFSTPVL